MVAWLCVLQAFVQAEPSLMPLQPPRQAVVLVSMLRGLCRPNCRHVLAVQDEPQNLIIVHLMIVHIILQNELLPVPPFTSCMGPLA